MPSGLSEAHNSELQELKHELRQLKEEVQDKFTLIKEELKHQMSKVVVLFQEIQNDLTKCSANTTTVKDLDFTRENNILNKFNFPL